VKGFVTAESLG